MAGNYDYTPEDMPFTAWHYQGHYAGEDGELLVAIWANGDDATREALKTGVYRAYTWVIKICVKVTRPSKGAPPPLQPAPPGVTMRGLMSHHGRGRGRALYYGMRGVPPEYMQLAMGHKGGINEYKRLSEEVTTEIECHYRILWDDE